MVITSLILRKSSQGRYSSRRRFKLKARVSRAPGWEWQRVTCWVCCNDTDAIGACTWSFLTTGARNSDNLDGTTPSSTLLSDNGWMGIGTWMVLNDDNGNWVNGLLLCDKLEPKKWKAGWLVVFRRRSSLPDDTTGRLDSAELCTFPTTSA